MNPPKKVKVSPYVLDVIDNSDLLGRLEADAAVNMRLQEIALDFGQTSTYLKDSLLHELLHALWRMSDLYDTSDAGFAYEERVMRVLSPKLLALLRDNPKLVQYLTEGV